jgi:hypothetical protein
MAKSTKSPKAFTYLRTSSAANIGEDKDSGRRQLQAIEVFAKRGGTELVRTFHDEAVKRHKNHHRRDSQPVRS